MSVVWCWQTWRWCFLVASHSKVLFLLFQFVRQGHIRVLVVLVFQYENWHGGPLSSNHYHHALMMPEMSSKQSVGVERLPPPSLCRIGAREIFCVNEKIPIPLIPFKLAFWLYNYYDGRCSNYKSWQVIYGAFSYYNYAESRSANYR